MTQSSGAQSLELTAVEQKVLLSVVTKFAVDLVLHRLDRGAAAVHSSALEEVATSAAMMLNEQRPPTTVESLAVHAILESVCTGAPEGFFRAIASDDCFHLTSDEIRMLARVLHGKLVSTGLRAAA